MDGLEGRVSPQAIEIIAPLLRRTVNDKSFSIIIFIFIL
jgi:hypothetical protein